MKIHNSLKVILLLITISFFSCNKSDGPSGNNERKLEYIITGNFSGALFASYTTGTGGTQNEQVTTVPWKKEIVYAVNVTAAIIAISGNGGTAGQQVTVVIKRGGSQVSSTTATANSSGSFTQSAPIVTF